MTSFFTNAPHSSIPIETFDLRRQVVRYKYLPPLLSTVDRQEFLMIFTNPYDLCRSWETLVGRQWYFLQSKGGILENNMIY